MTITRAPYPALTMHPQAAYATVGPVGGDPGYGGPKDCDNRALPTHKRGWIYIHAGLPTIKLPDDWAPLGYQPPAEATSSAIVGMARLIDCVMGYDSIWAIPGYYQYVWGNRIAFPNPIPMPGKQGWWYPCGRRK